MNFYQEGIGKTNYPKANQRQVLMHPHTLPQNIAGSGHEIVSSTNYGAQI